MSFPRSSIFYYALFAMSIFALVFCNLNSHAMDIPVEAFSLTPYSQEIQDYLPPTDSDYTTPLLSPAYQKKQVDQLYARDYGDRSPWDQATVEAILPAVFQIETENFTALNQEQPPHYGENFKRHDTNWFLKIKDNMALDALNQVPYQATNRAIAVHNTAARSLPENAPDFLSASLPGQGFPFDNLQESAVWVGTPLYVISESVDKAWSLVLTPDAYIAWIKSSDLAYVDDAFIQTWRSHARLGMIAITKTDASIVDTQGRFQFTGYIGAVFPQGEGGVSFLIPGKNNENDATIETGTTNTMATTHMPLSLTKKHFAAILEQLKNRPYGWGGSFFFNDCSAEMKSLFTPFGIWLPRNSGAQAELPSTLDLSGHDVDERLSLLKAKGHPLLTLINIRGHVMLYMGQKRDDGTIMTYQNIWGMSDVKNTKRYVIGQSVFLPLLIDFSEHPDILSEAAHRDFKLIYLDALDTALNSQENFMHPLLHANQAH